MGEAKGVDVLVPGYFTIEFQGAVKGAFQTVSGLDIMLDVSKYQGVDATTGKPVYMSQPGSARYSQISLSRGVTASNTDMWDWRKKVEDGDVEGARKNGSVCIYTMKDQKVAQFDFVNAWPSVLSGATIAAGNSDVVIESLILEHEGIKRTK